jgi:two-component sensor histidine kinase
MALISKALHLIDERRRSPFYRYGFAVISVFIATSLRLWADPFMPAGYPFLTYFPAVILTALTAGLWSAILAAILSGLAACFFFMPPAWGFTLDGPNAFALSFFFLVVAIDIAIIHLIRLALAQLRRERERALRAEEMALDHARQREVLFAELQHRVSNNLQLVSALLALQRADITDEGARRVLADAAARLALIGRIHRRLHDPNSAQSDFPLFLRELADDLLAAAGAEAVRCQVSAPPLPLLSEKMVPLALIVAELVSNAMEHGFAGRDGGRIDLVVTPVEGDQLCVIVSDDGVGLPPGFDLARTHSLGLRLVKLLAQQIEASFEMRNATGTEARLVFRPG